MKHIYLLFFLMCTFFVVIGQQTYSIKGVVHREKGDPVAHVSVKIVNTTYTVLSDAKGRFEFNNVAAGNYSIEVSSLEIEKKILAINLNKDYSDLHIHLDAKGGIALEEARVERKTAKREIETSGFAANVIETKQASLRNIQTNELLDRSVGVRVRQSGGLGSEVSYNLNGMSGRSVGIFIDGLDISTYGSSFNLNNIPPAMIERIEVYKGVLPAHLSGDLLGGAINIIMKKGKEANTMTASLSYGSFNTMQADLSAMYRNAKTGFTTKFSGFYLNSDNDYEIWGKFSKYIHPNGVVDRNYRATRFFDGYRTYGARFEFGYTDVKWADSFFLGYNVSDSYKEIQHGQTMGTPYNGRTAEANAHVMSLVYAKKDFLLKGLGLNVNAIYSFRDTYIQDTVPWAYNWDGKIRVDLNGNPIRRSDGAQQGAPSMTDVKRQIANIRANLSYNINDAHKLSLNHVFYAVDRKDDNLLSLAGNAGFNSKNDVSNGVLAFNYEAQTFSKRLTTNVFYKLYHQTLSNSEYVGNLVNGSTVLTEKFMKNQRTNNGFGFAAAYSVTPRVIVTSSVERAIRMPGDTEIYGNPEGNVLSNSGIKPERSDNINVGFRLGTFKYDDHKVSLASNFFWRNIKDRIMPKANEMINNQEIELTQYVNLGIAQSVGFEGELSYIFKDNLTVRGNFSKFNSLFKQEFDPISGQKMTYYNQQIPNEPFFTVNGNVEYGILNVVQKSDQIRLFYTLGYVGSFSTVWPDSDWFVTPAQYSQNLGVSYVFSNRKIVASADVKNIFNAELYDNFGVQKPGRGIYLKLNYTINKF